MDDEILIVIRIKKTDTGYSSSHHIQGLGELAAGIILIDIGRDILYALASHHHGEAATHPAQAHAPVTIAENGEAGQALPSPDADGLYFTERDE